MYVLVLYIIREEEVGVLMGPLGSQGVDAEWLPQEAWVDLVQASSPHLVWVWVAPLTNGSSQGPLPQ